MGKTKKGQSAVLAFPVETMSGKLATKQKDIVYSGGKVFEEKSNPQTSTNFKKYVVMVNRKGSQGFFVKSRTTINYSAASMTNMSAIAAANATVLLLWANVNFRSQFTGAIKAMGMDISIYSQGAKGYLRSLVHACYNGKEQSVSLPLLSNGGVVQNRTYYNSFCYVGSTEGQNVLPIGSEDFARYVLYLTDAVRFSIITPGKELVGVGTPEAGSTFAKLIAKTAFNILGLTVNAAENTISYEGNQLYDAVSGDAIANVDEIADHPVLTITAPNA